MTKPRETASRAPESSDEQAGEATPEATPLPDFGPAAHSVCEALGDLMAFWGFQRSHGRIWALLYLLERPLHAGEITATLHLSVGQVSMSVRELERWGVIHPIKTAGQRRTYYRPELNLFRMITKVFQEREMEQIRTLAQTLQRALAELRAQAPSDAAVNLRLRRLEGLIAAAELGRSLVERLIAGTLLPKAVVAALDRPIAD